MFDFIWKFGLGFASCILLGLWLDRKNGSAQAGGTPSAAGATEAPAAKTDATETTDSEEAPSDPAAAESAPEGETVLELTEDGLPKADIRTAPSPATAAVAEQINWKRVGAVAGKVLKALWKITVWIFKNSSKLAGSYSYDNMAGKNIQSS